MIADRSTRWPPWDRAHAWPGCQRVIIDNTGHEGSAEMTALLSQQPTDSLRTSVDAATDVSLWNRGLSSCPRVWMASR